MKNAGNVVLLGEASYEGSASGRETAVAPGAADSRAAPRGRRSKSVRSCRAPFPALANAALGIGHNLFVLDTDGPLRRTTPFVRSEGHPVPSLAVAAYMALSRVPPAVRLEDRVLAIGNARLPLIAFPVPRVAGETGP